MEQQTGHGNGELDRFTDEELEILDEIPIWHQKFFLNMPNYSGNDLSNIEKIRSGLDRFKSDDSARYNGAVFRVHEYHLAVRGIHEIDIIGSILSLMFPIMGFPNERGLLRIRLLRAAGVDVTGISADLTFKDAYELDKQVISIKSLRLFIECNTFFTDYLCVATLKIWKKYIDQNKNYHSGFDNAVESALFGNSNAPPTIQPPTNEPPTDTPDGLPIPWLMKEIKREGAIALMLKAAYMAFRQLPERRNPDREELWLYLTPENLPEFISKRDRNGITRADSNHQWTKKDFLTAYPVWFGVKNSE